MDFNVWWVGGVVLFGILLIIWMIIRNNRDKKKFVKDLISSETVIEKPADTSLR